MIPTLVPVHFVKKDDVITVADARCELDFTLSQSERARKKFPLIVDTLIIESCMDFPESDIAFAFTFAFEQCKLALKLFRDFFR